VQQKLERFNVAGSSSLKRPLAGVREGRSDVVEKMDINQGKLCLGCRSDVTIFAGDYHGFAVMNSILGGGTHSKLFNEVREKNSLAYYSYSFIEKFKGLLMIASGIDFDNFEKARDICIEQIGKMKAGEVSEYELKSAKKKLISDLKTVSDSQYTLIDYISTLRAYGISYNIEDIIGEIDEVTLDRVVKCANSIELNTIYYLTKQ
ncbi:MAG: insulinase family protein, partial [Bacillota bacterium]|nr:insulinase family protein [Bacillota bacterium]